MLDALTRRLTKKKVPLLSACFYILTGRSRRAAAPRGAAFSVGKGKEALSSGVALEAAAAAAAQPGNDGHGDGLSRQGSAGSGASLERRDAGRPQAAGSPVNTVAADGGEGRAKGAEDSLGNAAVAPADAESDVGTAERAESTAAVARCAGRARGVGGCAAAASTAPEAACPAAACADSVAAAAGAKRAGDAPGCAVGAGPDPAAG